MFAGSGKKEEVGVAKLTRLDDLARNTRREEAGGGVPAVLIISGEEEFGSINSKQALTLLGYEETQPCVWERSFNDGKKFKLRCDRIL